MIKVPREILHRINRTPGPKFTEEQLREDIFGMVRETLETQDPIFRLHAARNINRALGGDKKHEGVISQIIRGYTSIQGEKDGIYHINVRRALEMTYGDINDITFTNKGDANTILLYRGKSNLLTFIRENTSKEVKTIIHCDFQK